MPLQHSGFSTEQGRTDTIAMLIGKMLHMQTGDDDALKQGMRTLMEGGPERMGAVITTLLNLLCQYTTRSGQYPQGTQQLIDFLISQNEKAAQGKGQLKVVTRR